MLAAGLFAAYVASAAYNIPLVNGSFETLVPPTTIQVRGFDNGEVWNGSGDHAECPGWSNVVSVMNDSGLENGGYGALNRDGVKNAYFMAGTTTNDAGAFQITGHTIAADDIFVLDFKALVIWNNANVTVELFYDTPANVITNFSAVPAASGWWGDTYTTYSLTNTPPVEAYGGKLGILFKNGGPDINNCWLAVDDVSLQNLAIAPFIFTDYSPSGSGLTNDVIITQKVIDDESEFSSATVYLDSWTNVISSSASGGGGTNTVSTSIDPQTLVPGSAHTVYVVVDGINPVQSFTNSWDFSMADAFDLTISPVDGGSALDYDYRPTVDVRIIEVNDTISYPYLFIDGVDTASPVGGFGTPTNTISYKFPTAVEPGSNFTAKVVVEGSVYGNVTNEWTFTMGGGVGVTIWGTNDPTPGAFDEYAFAAPAADADNLSTVDDQTYVAGNQPVQGQFFTTPAGNGFQIESVWLRHTPYDAGSTGTGVGGQFTVRIVDPALSNTASFVKYTSTTNMVVLNDGLVTADGRWMQFRLENPVVLNANKTYGFDVGSPGPWFDTCGVAAGGYAGGEAYSSGTGGVGNNTVTPRTGDRTFMVSLSETGEPFSIDSVSPSGAGAQNPVTLEVDVTELNAVFDSANTKLYLDGVEQTTFSGGGGPWTISANVSDLDPLTVHTGMVLVASSSPVLTVTNSWTFTMDDSFVFTAQIPDGFLFTNQTPISVKILNTVDTCTGATMYLLDGGVTNDVGATYTGGGVTNTLELASSGVLAAGDHTVMVIASGLSYGDKTNTWTFGVAGGAGLYTWTSTDPVTNEYDIAQFFDTPSNIDDDDAWTYVAMDRPAQGQLFTTPSGGSGYQLTDVWVQRSTAGWDNLWTDQSYHIRIVDPALTNTPYFVLHEETLDVKNVEANMPGRWLQLVLDTPIVLEPGKEYGYDIAGMAGGLRYFEVAGYLGSTNTIGRAYVSGSFGVGNDTLTVYTNDVNAVRTFAIELDGGYQYVPFNAFGVTGTPEGFSWDSNLVVEATIIDQTLDPALEETLNTAELYVDNVLLTDVINVSGGTNTVTASSATYSPGSHTAMLIATGTVFPANSYTSTWEFVVGGIPGVYIQSTNNPAFDADDVYNFATSSNDVSNVGGGDDAATYVANNRPVQGQIFTTGAGTGYELSSVWVRHVGYSSAVGFDSTAMALTIRITDPAQTNSAGFVVYSEDLNLLNPSLADADGKWIEIKLTTPVALSASTTYGFDVGSGWPWFEINGTVGDSAAGAAYSSGANGVGDNTVAIAAGDRTFLVDLTEVSVGPIPTTLGVSVSGSDIVISWPVADGSGNVYTNSDLVNGLWGLYGAGSVNGDNYEVVIPSGVEQQLFIKAE